MVGSNVFIPVAAVGFRRSIASRVDRAKKLKRGPSRVRFAGRAQDDDIFAFDIWGERAERGEERKAKYNSARDWAGGGDCGDDLSFAEIAGARAREDFR